LPPKTQPVNYMIRSRFVHVLLVLSLLTFISIASFARTFQKAQEGTELKPADTTAVSGNKAEEGKFDAGSMILEHVVDNHEWHIAKIGNTDICIPLPVMIWCEGQFHFFMSSKFHNETHSYQGFTISEKDATKGRIITVKEEMTGTGPRVLDLSITKTVLAILISGLILIVIFVSIANRYKREPNKAPHGLQNMMETLILFVRDDVAKSSIGEKR